jgi:hypothetical protein
MPRAGAHAAFHFLHWFLPDSVKFASSVSPFSGALVITVKPGQA